MREAKQGDSRCGYWRSSPFQGYEYRVTRWGLNDINNRLPAVKT